MNVIAALRKWLVVFFALPASASKGRIVVLLLACVLVYTSTLAALWIAWYKPDTTVPFHWFDDSGGWMLMDKFGHFFTAFVECSVLAKVWRWTGLSMKQCLFIGAGMAIVAQCSYELFDGLSAGYGASVTDLVANVLGVGAVLLQFFFFKRLLVFSKFSFHTTALAYLRPAFFGESIFQQVLKDYNGQTYWFTLDVNGMLGRKVFPDWLFFSVGYGADGLLGGDDNVWTEKSGIQRDYSHILRSNRLLFSFDFNWDKVSNSFLRKACQVFLYIKFPAPAVEFHAVKGLRFYWMYF